MKTKLLEIIISDLAFPSFIERFPEFYSDAVIIRQNKTPELRESALQRIINKASRELSQFIDKYTLSKPGINMAGKVITIQKTDEAYKKIIDISITENWSYRGISVVETYDSLKLFFY